MPVATSHLEDFTCQPLLVQESENICMTAKNYDLHVCKNICYQTCMVANILKNCFADWLYPTHVNLAWPVGHSLWSKCGSLVKASESPFASLMMKWWFQWWFAWTVSFWDRQLLALGTVCEAAEKGYTKGREWGKEQGENTAKWSKTKSRGISGANHRRKRAE